MPNITLNEALHDYYDQRSARYELSTWRAHEGQLERFRSWATREYGPNCLLSDVSERDMVRYFNRLRPPAHAASTFNNYRQYLNMFWSYCRGEAYVERNPMRHVDAAAVPRRVRLQLSAEELLAMLDGSPAHDRIALALGMNTALRAKDVAVLSVGSVNLANNQLTAYIHKTKTWDVLPITAELRAEIIRWFGEYARGAGLERWEDLPMEWTLVPPVRYAAVNPHRPELGGRLVYRSDGRHTHPERIVQRALERLGYPTRQEGFHTLRRSAARSLFDLAVNDKVGDPIRVAQALLGHKNQSTTEVYLGITHEKKLRDQLMQGQSFLGRAAANDAEGRREADEKGRRSA